MWAGNYREYKSKDIRSAVQAKGLRGQRSGSEEAYRLKERDTAKKPIEHVTKFAPMYECPSCGNIDVYGQIKCDECGQRLDWGE